MCFKCNQMKLLSFTVKSFLVQNVTKFLSKFCDIPNWNFKNKQLSVRHLTSKSKKLRYGLENGHTWKVMLL